MRKAAAIVWTSLRQCHNATPVRLRRLKAFKMGAMGRRTLPRGNREVSRTISICTGTKSLSQPYARHRKLEQQEFSE